MRLLLCLTGYHPTTDPSVIGEYRWMPEHEAYVWEGRAMDVEEFNAAFQPWLKRQAGIRGAGLLNVKALPELPAEPAPTAPLSLAQEQLSLLDKKLQSAALLAPPKPKKRKHEDAEPSSSGSKPRRPRKPRAEPGA